MGPGAMIWVFWMLSFKPTYSLCSFTFIKRLFNSSSLFSSMLLLLLSLFIHVWLCVTPQMAAHQAPLPMGFSRQEYWSGLPFPSPTGPITSWQIDGNIMTDFIFLGSKITADGDCSHEVKRCLLLGRKAMNNLDSILKSRDILCHKRSI